MAVADVCLLISVCIKLYRVAYPPTFPHSHIVTWLKILLRNVLFSFIETNGNILLSSPFADLMSWCFSIDVKTYEVFIRMAYYYQQYTSCYYIILDNTVYWLSLTVADVCLLRSVCIKIIPRGTSAVNSHIPTSPYPFLLIETKCLVINNIFFVHKKYPSLHR